MKLSRSLLLIVLLVGGFGKWAVATHNRAGEIIYEVKGYLTYSVTIITYTKTSSRLADRDTLELHWGDGTVEKVLRTNGPRGGPNNIPQGVELENDIKRNEYRTPVPHTYAGPLPYYIISVRDPNRIDNIINIQGGASVDIAFYLEDTLVVFNPTFVGYNNSPILLYPPIDYANRNDTFYHNPIAFDPDGDSLHFRLVPPRSASGVNVPAYQYPDQINPGINNQFTINPNTGEIIWATPQRPGIYNIAILITEYRNGIKMGTMVRDMQIIVLDELNDPPQIVEFEDTCVIAGTLLTKTVTASDRNTGQSVELTSAGGPFQLSISPARFTAPSPDNPISGLFEWQTTCHHIRRQFYSVIFKAKDSYPVPLVDLKTWIIKVIAPPPENLQAVSQNNSILLTWENPYACDAVEDFIGFSIWRRNGSNDFTVDTCVPGLNGRGYTKIAQNIMSYSFVDSGLQRGNIYCYRVLAEFAKRTESGLFYNKVESLPSNEACAELSRNVPIIHEVNVLVTDVDNGAIEVSWYRPVPDSALTPPYRFDVYRSDGFLPNNPVLVRSFTNNILGNLDTTFIDTPLNTVAQPYTYEVAFYASDMEIGKSDAASSVFIQTVPSSNQVDLSWNEEVPWINYSYVIYRRQPGGIAFDSLTTVGVQSYTDAGLINGQEYCYYVRSIGRYSSPDLSDTLENNSQEKCEIPVDIIPPCAPVLEVNNSCQGETEVQNSPCRQPALENFLTWTNPQDAGCDQDMVEYRIYFAQTNRDSLQLLTTVPHAQGTSYTHFLDHSIAGCYAVSAVDTYANESPLSNIVCLDNCPCYALPNVFTPNGDGHNDLFTPFVDSLTGKPMHRFIEKVDFRVFNRWGTLVFETHNPDLNWDGTDINTGEPVKEGVYYYVCTVYEIRVDGVIKNSKPLSGFIHLIRGNYN